MADEPKGPEVENFLFSLKRIGEAEKDLDLQIQAIDAAVDKLVRGIEINGINILGHLLNLTHEEAELERLGKALLKIAPLIAKHDDLTRRKSVFELAQKEPGWLAWAFGDFSAELDTLTPEGFNQD